MAHAFIIFVVISLLELLLWLPPFWQHIRKPAACVTIVLLSSLSGWLVGTHWSIWVGLVFIGSVYRVVNLLRLIEGRSPVNYMAASTLRTSILLIVPQLIFFALALHEQNTSVPLSNWVDTAAIIDIVFAVPLLVGTLKRIRHSEATPLSKHYSEQDLPTLTVAIPARNETDDLEACLNSLISSNYPKLEVLVLDDCSQNKQTPGIIKDFAHAGVRFIAGKNPPKHWLAKNYAYQQLLDEANGEIVLFCGVDARFEVNSLETMIGTMLSAKLSMLSILPHNVLPAGYNPESVIIQPVRYAWELALPRGWLKRPPVLSTCWLVSATLLKESGGFKAITNSTSVESYFAQIAARNKDGYSFLQSGQVLGLSSHKSVNEQRATAIRIRYPQTHRRPEIVAALSVLEVLLLVLPYALVVYALLTQSWMVLIVAIVNVVLVTVFYSKVVRVTYGTFLLRSLWLLPFAAVYDVCLLNYSMWLYEFDEVVWKGRNVCIPLMHSVPQEPAS